MAITHGDCSQYCWGCPDDDDHDREEDKESLSGANQQKEEDEVNTALPMSCTPALPNLGLDFQNIKINSSTYPLDFFTIT